MHFGEWLADLDEFFCDAEILNQKRFLLRPLPAIELELIVQQLSLHGLLLYLIL